MDVPFPRALVVGTPFADDPTSIPTEPAPTAATPECLAAFLRVPASAARAAEASGARRSGDEEDDTTR